MSHGGCAPHAREWTTGWWKVLAKGQITQNFALVDAWAQMEIGAKYMHVPWASHAAKMMSRRNKIGAFGAPPPTSQPSHGERRERWRRMSKNESYTGALRRMQSYECE